MNIRFAMSLEMCGMTDCGRRKIQKTIMRNGHGTGQPHAGLPGSKSCDLKMSRAEPCCEHQEQVHLCKAR